MEVSNPDKVLYPDIDFTKNDLVEYYRSVSDLILPHVVQRPLTLQRFPNGIEGAGFMQKNVSKHFPDLIRRVEVPKVGGTVVHPVIVDEPGLLYLANQGTITFHIWGSRDSDLDHPDRLVVDLDPPAGDFEQARQATIEAGEFLRELGVSPGVMTTGSNGYHVVTRLDGSASFERLDVTSRAIAELIAARDPDRMTTEFRKKDRGNRVFIDWLRNRWAQTSVCPWSLRPKAGAPVAAPIDWDQLPSTDPVTHTASAHPGVDAFAALPVANGLELSQRVDEALAESGIEIEPFDRFGRS